jgi:sulfofructose kinase
MTSNAITPAKAPKILCIGIPVRDLVFQVKDLPARGNKEPASKFDELAGGNALNAAVGIRRLGGRAAFAGPMGDADEKPARYIFDQMDKEGIDHSGVVHMPGLVTPISNILIDPSGERTIVTFRDPALWNTQLRNHDALLEDCAAILTESRCAGFVTELCVEASRRNIPVVLDADNVMSMREGVLKASSHIIFSAEALAATAGVHDNETALRRMAGTTSAFLAVTLGADGMKWLDDAGKLQTMPTFPVHTVDTLGAGDVFHGAFALAIAEGASIEHAMRFASAAAAIKCTRFGGAFAAPSREEVNALLAKSSGRSSA